MRSSFCVFLLPPSLVAPSPSPSRPLTVHPLPSLPSLCRESPNLPAHPNLNLIAELAYRTISRPQRQSPAPPRQSSTSSSPRWRGSRRRALDLANTDTDTDTDSRMPPTGRCLAAYTVHLHLRRFQFLHIHFVSIYSAAGSHRLRALFLETWRLIDVVAPSRAPRSSLNVLFLSAGRPRIWRASKHRCRCALGVVLNLGARCCSALARTCTFPPFPLS